MAEVQSIAASRCNAQDSDSQHPGAEHHSYIPEVFASMSSDVMELLMHTILPQCQKRNWSAMIEIFFINCYSCEAGLIIISHTAYV